MAKKSIDEVSARRMMVLERIWGNHEGISLSTLASSLPKNYQVNEATIRKDVEELTKYRIIEIKNKKVYAVPTALESMWSGTPIGPRLAPSEAKSRLAKAVFSFVKKHKSKIGRLILGGGTTTHGCACELIRGSSQLGDMRIHTASLLILHEFIMNKPVGLHIESPGGELNFNTAALWSDDIPEYFREVEAQAVITSFSDMSFERGFCTVHHDVAEKLANLRPNPRTCSWVVIPIEWKKVARHANIPVADSRVEQLDFVEGKRKYVIITNKPSEEGWNTGVDDEKLEDLSKWKEEYPEGIEIIYA